MIRRRDFLKLSGAAAFSGGLLRATRAADSPEVIAGRMAKAASELSHFPEYDYVVVNRDLDESVARVRAILTAERQRRERVKGLVEFVRGLQGE